MKEAKPRKAATTTHQRLSDRHREWGWNCPAVDGDQMIFLEYDRSNPVALIDFKGINPNKSPTNTEAWRRMCDERDRPVPFWEVHYREKPWRFFRKPINKAARAVQDQKPISELKFVTWLYGLRNRPVPDDVRTRLANGQGDRSRTLNGPSLPSLEQAQAMYRDGAAWEGWASE